ncbi:MAG: LCP family protein [Cyanobacteria bacterium MAG IRC1_bin_28]|nr:LCP family protein [Cyanobacteria bacterium MAG IRC3_bin_20]MCY3653436.1 LCP family protein [Cyanobacteria bacterium MAG IRC1_bin_28]MXY19626.1 LytR family transcriptional regulator [Synechococcus sp. SB0664_bin_36]MYK07266.1 LytR family transcriptional regulator [Synechococcus sp. SB0670_bin_20]
MKVDLKHVLLRSPWRWAMLPLLLVTVFWGGQQVLSPEARHRFSRPGDVVLLGIDPIGANADVVVAIRLQHDQTRITQIPRDTFTHSEARGSWKIGELYSLAGAEAVQEQVAELVDADFPHLVVVHEGVVAALVDALGGLTVTVPTRMVYRDRSQGLLIDLEPGRQRLNGQQVEHFIRWRGRDGDIGRLERRQEVINALDDVFQSPVTWTRLPMLKQVLEDQARAGRLVTDLDLQALPAIVRGFASGGAIIETLPGREGYYEGLSYWFAEEGALPPEPAHLSPRQDALPSGPATPPESALTPGFVPPALQDTLPFVAPPPVIPPPIEQSNNQAGEP